MADGVLIIDKPSEWTSQDVCAKLRGVFHEKRIGHGGTLDPMATGVLPVFVGRATRAVEFVMEGEKEYLAGLRLGLVTNTQDTTGEVLKQRPVSVTRAELEAALERFRGDILQVPPMYSAIKIGGKKLYELARKGREVERPPRKVTIHALTVEGQTGRGTSPCGCGAPRAPTCAPCATTSGPPWAAGGACPPCGGPWPPASPWPRPTPWRRCWPAPTRRPC